MLVIDNDLCMFKNLMDVSSTVSGIGVFLSRYHKVPCLLQGRCFVNMWGRERERNHWYCSVRRSSRYMCMSGAGLLYRILNKNFWPFQNTWKRATRQCSWADVAALQCRGKLCSMVVKTPESWSQPLRYKIPALPCTSCVTLRNFLTLSESPLIYQ